MEELPKLTFDLLSFLSWSRKAEEYVIGIAQVAKASVVGVCGVVGRKVLLAFPKCFSFLPSPCLLSPKGFMLHTYVGHVGLSLVSFVVQGHEDRFNEAVQFVEVDVGQDWTEDRALWASTQGRMVAPFFQISSREQRFDQSKETTIMNVLSKNVHQDRMIERIETGGYVALHKPGRSYPLVVHLPERGVTSSVWAEAVGMVAELGFKVGREDQPKNLLKQLV